jgi:membrane protein
MKPPLLTGLAVVTLAFTALARLPPPDTSAAPVRHSDPEASGAAAPPAPGLGRDAGKPTDIPARGWWSIAKRVAASISEHRLLTEAAGITFYTLLALFPALAALVSIYGLFANPATISDHLNAISQVVPGGGMQIITDRVQSLTSNGNKALGFALVIGLATSLWSANQASKALFDALNVVYDEREKRGFVLRTAVTLAFTVGGILFADLIGRRNARRGKMVQLECAALRPLPPARTTDYDEVTVFVTSSSGFVLRKILWAGG